MSRLRWWPRRTNGLPPGQRLLAEMPRFSDRPTLAPPPVPEEPQLTLRSGATTVLIPISGLTQTGRFEPVEVVADFHCVTTWSVRALRWRGVRLRDVTADAFGDERPASFASVSAADDVAARFVVDDLLGDDVLLATELDGIPLDLRHGAPLRLVSPRQYGYKNVKHVVSIDFSDREPESAFGAKEHLRGRVAHEERHSRLPNAVVRWPYRVMIPATVRVAERTLRRHPDGAPVRTPDAR